MKQMENTTKKLEIASFSESERNTLQSAAALLGTTDEKFLEIYLASLEKRHPMQTANVTKAKYTGPELRWDWGVNTGPFKRKKQGIGSYDAPIILGVSPYKSPIGLYHEIRGEVEKPPATYLELAETGSLLEPVVAELYMRRTKRRLIDRAEYKPSGRWDTRVNREHQWWVAAIDMEIEDPGLTTGASEIDCLLPGGVIPEGPGALEMKTTEMWAEFFDENGDPPLPVIIQFQHQLGVTGFQWGSIAVLMGRKFYWVDLPRDDEAIQYIFDEEQKFWQGCFDGVPPPPDDHKKTGDDLARRHPKSEVKSVELSEDLSKALETRYMLVTDAEVEAKKELEGLKNRVKLEMETAEAAFTYGGAMNFTWRTQKKADPKWTVKGNRTEEERKQLTAMKAEYKKPPKDPPRVFRKVAEKKKKGA